MAVPAVGAPGLRSEIRRNETDCGPAGKRDGTGEQEMRQPRWGGGGGGQMLQRDTNCCLLAGGAVFRSVEFGPKSELCRSAEAVSFVSSEA